MQIPQQRVTQTSVTNEEDYSCRREKSNQIREGGGGGSERDQVIIQKEGEGASLAPFTQIMCQIILRFEITGYFHAIYTGLLKELRREEFKGN